MSATRSSRKHAPISQPPSDVFFPEGALALLLGGAQAGAMTGIVFIQWGYRYAERYQRRLAEQWRTLRKPWRD